MVTNQTTMIGPKILPTLPVPRRWIEKSPTSTTQVSGTTQGLKPGAASSSPSRADSTEMAGVIIPSPNRSAAPAMTRSATKPIPTAERFGSSARSARMPPSPRLSARMTKLTYFTETARMSAQRMSEMTPKMSARSSGTPGWASDATCSV